MDAGRRLGSSFLLSAKRARKLLFVCFLSWFFYVIPVRAAFTVLLQDAFICNRKKTSRELSILGSHLLSLDKTCTCVFLLEQLLRMQWNSRMRDGYFFRALIQRVNSLRPCDTVGLVNISVDGTFMSRIGKLGTTSFFYAIARVSFLGASVSAFPRFLVTSRPLKTLTPSRQLKFSNVPNTLFGVYFLAN